MNALAPIHRRLFYAATAGLFLTGVAWLAAWEKAAAMALHGALGMLALVLVGGLLPWHVARGWSQSRHRPTGASALGATALLAISGHLLYYAGDETLRAIASDVHVVVGLALPALLALHVRRRVTFKAEEETR
jgi:hypothetical protein